MVKRELSARANSVKHKSAEQENVNPNNLGTSWRARNIMAYSVMSVRYI
jgi:hypothetical protein